MISETGDVDIETAQVEVVVVTPKLFQQSRSIYCFSEVTAESEQDL